MTLLKQLSILCVLSLTTLALCGKSSQELQSSPLTMSYYPEESSHQYNITDAELQEIGMLWQNYTSDLTDYYQVLYYMDVEIGHLVTNGTGVYFTDDIRGDSGSFDDSEIYEKDDLEGMLQKRHLNCDNRNYSYKCQGCNGKFLKYSSAHNCNGKAVSCCIRSGPAGKNLACTCYKRNKAVALDLGSAGCCTS